MQLLTIKQPFATFIVGRSRIAEGKLRLKLTVKLRITVRRGMRLGGYGICIVKFLSAILIHLIYLSSDIKHFSKT